MADNLANWNRMSRPPPDALKTIQAGRLKGKSDINPQFRYKIMTEVFGPCGIGWAWSVKRLWAEPAHDGQTFAFAEVELRVKEGENWSEPIPGIGGHFLVIKESAGLHANDEAYKMAVTDALGTAMKMLGVAADVYAGLWDGSKFKEPGSRWEGQFQPHGGQPPVPPSAPAPAGSPCPPCPICNGPCWDNRGKKTNPKQPDAKCRNKECKGVVWEIDPQTKQAPQQGPLAPPAGHAGSGTNADAMAALIVAAGEQGINAVQLGQFTIVTMSRKLEEVKEGALVALRKKLTSGEVAQWLKAQQDTPF